MVLKNPDKPFFDLNNPPNAHKIAAEAAALKIHLSKEKLEELCRRLGDLFTAKNIIFAEEFSALARQLCDSPDDGWRILSLKTNTGSNILPTATVVLQSPLGQHITAQDVGAGCTEALCSAISEATGIRVFLKDFSFDMLSSGLNALGRASVTIEYHNQQVRAFACSIDIIAAIAEAYLTAINIILDRINNQKD